MKTRAGAVSSRLFSLPVFLLAALALTLLGLPRSAAANGARTVNDAITVLDEIMAIPEKGISPSLLKNAHAIAVIPGTIKVGFVVGGRHGKGVLSLRQGAGWSPPSFITFTGGSIGWQIGAQSADIILVFKSARSIENIMRGKFTLGADASVAAGPVGRQAEAATDVELKAEIYSYSRTRGLFAGLSVEGAALQIDWDENESYYGSKGVTPRDVFDGKGITAPTAIGVLRAAIKKHAGK